MSTRSSGQRRRVVKTERDVLCLSLSPLLALRIDFREWETLLLGTARTIGGRRSSRGCSTGSARLNGVCDAKNDGAVVRVSHGRRKAEKIERV